MHAGVFACSQQDEQKRKMKQEQVVGVKLGGEKKEAAIDVKP